MKPMEMAIEQLRSKTSEMGLIAENLLDQVHIAVNEEDDQGASVIPTILQQEERLDQLQVEIDNEAIRILSLYSPVASDLRFVFSATRVSAELERIGDHAKNICRSLQLMRNKANTKPIATVRKMAEIVVSMLKDAMLAFVRRDSSLANATIAGDEIVDALNDKVIDEMLHEDLVNRSIDAPVDLAAAMAQILLGRSLERIGDQTTNICEEVVYMVKGDDIRHRT